MRHYRYSTTSKYYLRTVHPELKRLCELALEYSTIDFGISCGVRTKEQQDRLFLENKSQVDGDSFYARHVRKQAVDIVILKWGMDKFGNKTRLFDNDLDKYAEVMEAFRKAAIKLNIHLRLGIAFHIKDVREWKGTIKEAMNKEISLAHEKGKTPFIDGVHAETYIPE